MIKKYKIDYRKLALLLLPIALRKPILTAYLHSAMAAITQVSTNFKRFRDDTNYRLNHNSQVCHLRAVLNDRFDPVQRRITISDIAPLRGNIIYKRTENKPFMLPKIISQRGFGGADGYDFQINVPFTLSQAQLTQMRALSNIYKLASKRYIITIK